MGPADVGEGRRALAMANYPTNKDAARKMASRFSETFCPWVSIFLRGVLISRLFAAYLDPPKLATVGAVTLPGKNATRLGGIRFKTYNATRGVLPSGRCFFTGGILYSGLCRPIWGPLMMATVGGRRRWRKIQISNANPARGESGPA